ncbi:unnamed protein product, partial [marine sediment metagenome]
MGKNRHSKQDKKQNHKKQKPGSQITVVKKITSNGEDKIVNENENGNLVLTPEDNAQYKIVKAKQAKAIQAKIDYKQSLIDAQEALQ